MTDNQLLKISSMGQQITLEYHSESKEGPLVFQDFVIKVSIVDSSEIAPALVPVRLNYRECAPADFRGAPIDDVSVTIGTKIKEKTILLVLDQSPCAFE